MGGFAAMGFAMRHAAKMAVLVSRTIKDVRLINI